MAVGDKGDEGRPGQRRWAQSQLTAEGTALKGGQARHWDARLSRWGVEWRHAHLIREDEPPTGGFRVNHGVVVAEESDASAVVSLGGGASRRPPGVQMSPGCRLMLTGGRINAAEAASSKLRRPRTGSGSVKRTCRPRRRSPPPSQRRATSERAGAGKARARQEIFNLSNRLRARKFLCQRKSCRRKGQICERCAGKRGQQGGAQGRTITAAVTFLKPGVLGGIASTSWVGFSGCRQNLWKSCVGTTRQAT